MSLEERVEEAKRELARLLGNAYAPYSGIRVAAAVLAESGKAYYGVNVENASYGLTICAERAAVAAMVTGGDRRIEAVVIAASTPEPLPPCGACRQVIAEFGSPSTLVVSFSPLTGSEEKWTLGELLPHAFTGRQLRRPGWEEERSG